MKKEFSNVFKIAPPLIKDGVYYYDSQDAGDQFSLEEVVDTYNSGFFKKVFNNGRTIHREVFNILAEKVNEINKPYMEISCGPGLGLAPFIKNINPNLPALITDACPYIIEYWHKYTKDNNIKVDFSFASFDNSCMPIKDNSIDVITSYLGISSTRTNGEDEMNCLKELYRVLKHGGYVFTIENEIANYEDVELIFEKPNRFNYYHDKKVIGTLEQRIEKAGFTIFEKFDLGKTKIDIDQCELGELASEFGIDVYFESKAFILVKE